MPEDEPGGKAESGGFVETSVSPAVRRVGRKRRITTSIVVVVVVVVSGTRRVTTKSTTQVRRNEREVSTVIAEAKIGVEYSTEKLRQQAEFSVGFNDTARAARKRRKEQNEEKKPPPPLHSYREQIP